MATWITYVEALGTPVAALIALVSALWVAAKQADTNRARDDRHRMDETTSLARALAAEVIFNVGQVEKLSNALTPGSLGQQAGDEGEDNELMGEIRLSLFEFPKGVYEANLSRLGLIDSVIVFRIVHFYSFLSVIETALRSSETKSDDAARSEREQHFRGIYLFGLVAGVSVKAGTLKKYMTAYAEDPGNWVVPEEELQALKANQ